LEVWESFEEPTSAEQISLTEHGVPSDPTGAPIGGRARSIVVAPAAGGSTAVASALESAAGELLAQASAYAVAHPGVRIELSWQPVEGSEDGS
jgi:hypothetical protein